MSAEISNNQNKDNINILQDIYRDADTNQSEVKSKLSGDEIKKNIKDVFADNHRMERILAWGTLGFGALALVFGVFHFRNLVSSSVRVENSLFETRIDTSSANINEELLGLTQIDSDEDGLSDYDELYIYVTSPFLPDTDSDNKPDLQEIQQGTDPNCAYETDCAATNTLAPPPPDDDELLGTIALEGQITPSNVRLLLEQIGVSSERLDQLTDVQVLLVYQELLERQGLTDSGQTSNEPRQIVGQGELDELSAQDLRALLLANGVSQDTLDVVTDDELLLLLRDAVQTN